MSHLDLAAPHPRQAGRVRAGREEDLCLEALVVHPGRSVARGGNRVLDQHGRLVQRLGRDRPNHHVSVALPDGRDRPDPVEGEPGRHEGRLCRGSRDRRRARVEGRVPVERLHAENDQQRGRDDPCDGQGPAVSSQHHAPITAVWNSKNFLYSTPPTRRPLS